MIAGIDCGLGGAVAFLDPETLAVEVFDMPTFRLAKRREVDIHALAALLDRPLDHVFVETAGTRPGQGRVSACSFCRGYGYLIGLLVGRSIPHTPVAASVWARSLAVPAAKDASRQRASQLLPKAADNWPLKKHDGRSDAALIALFGARSLGLHPAPAATGRRRNGARRPLVEAMR
jgi:crossover junction endodeoxyribonuclease RuvC